MVRIKVTRRRLRQALGATLLGSTMLAGGVAFAAAPNTVQEVIVTADKRAESIQKVPMSIQALDTKKLEELNITDFQDYSKYLPSLSVETTGPSSTSITMRGIASGEDYNHSGPLPTVGFYLDEQPITTIGGTLDIHIYDIARIESLAGPQGTLYGASSESGTVRIITNKPSPAGFSASYDVQGNSVDHGGLGGAIEGYVNIPINDKMAVRLVGWDVHDAGYIDNVHSTRDFSEGQHIDNAAFVKKDFNYTDTYGARGALKIDLNDSWSVTPSIIAQDQRQHGVYGFNPSVGDLKVEHFGPDSAHDRWYQAALTVQGKIGKYDLTYSGGYFHRQLDSIADYMDYSYAYDQASGYAYYWASSVNGHPYDPSYWTPAANPRQFIVGRDEFWKNSQEIRIASPSTDRFRFVAGLYYQRQNHWIIQDYQIAGFAPELSVPHWPQTLWLTNQMRQDQDEAAYGQFDFDITDKLTLTAGIRGYNYRNFLRGFFGYSEPFSSVFFPADGFGPGGVNCIYGTQIYRNGPGCININHTTSGSGETHRITLTYKIDPEKLVYATYSTGYRPGGVNRVSAAPPYGADFLTNYEIGWKTTWMDHRLRWNGAIYDEVWNNFQFSFLVPPSLTAIANAGHARVLGVESNIEWVPTEHLTITAAGAYNDARLTENYCGVVGVTNCPSPLAPKNETLPRTPPFKGNLTARYIFDMGGWNAHLEGSAVYASSTWPELILDDRNNVGKLPSYSIFDFAFGAEHGNLSWELFVKNAFDERAQMTRTTPCTTSVCSPPTGAFNYSAVYAVPVVPRMIGFRFGQKF